MQYIIKFGLLHARLSIHARLKIDDGKTFAVFLDDVRVRLGVLENLFAEAVFYEVNESLVWNRADGRACGRERDDEFSALVHDA